MDIKDIDFNKDYYGVLGVSKDASESDIKAAFRKMSLKYHPDRHTNDSDEDKKKSEGKFVEVNEAYTILSDKNLRQAYDAGQQDPFASFMGGMRTPQGPQPGQGLIVRVKVTYDEICNGIKDKPVKYHRMVRCSKCHGKGGEDVQECPYCHGTGVIVETTQRLGMIMHQERTCPHCHGRGKRIMKVCDNCNGMGLVKTDETYNFTANTEHLVQNGAQLFAGYYGNESTDENGINGELVFEVIHDLPAGKQIVLTTSGWTVVETREIPYYDMLLGTKENIMTPSGKKIAVTVPECCIEGKQLRARGQGFNVDGYGKGDYILMVNTKPQSKLSKEEKDLLEKIKDLNK